MQLERMIKRGVQPLSTPSMRRHAITARNHLVSKAAAIRGKRSGSRLTPHFIVAGAQKAGTTFLYYELVRHPMMVPALTKEIHYFTVNYQRGAEWYSGFFPARSSRHVADNVITGEASPDYLFVPQFGPRVASDLPECKIILLFRDPVMRAYSHFQHNRRIGLEPLEDFGQALAAEESRFAQGGRWEQNAPTSHYDPRLLYSYRARGLYFEQLARLYEDVDESRVLVIFSEDLYRDPVRWRAEAAAFIGLEDRFAHRVGKNDMSSGSSGVPTDARHVLAEYFAPANERLSEALARSLTWTQP